MASNKLTTKQCDNAPEGTHFDGDGLYLLVKPDGQKYWRMACYLNKKRKLLAFGRYPKISLAAARQERAKAQELIAQGIDPVAQKKEALQKQVEDTLQKAKDAGNTFKQVAQRLHAAKAGKVTEETRNRMFRQFEIHLFPVIGHKPISEIKGAELLALLRSVAEKSNHGRPMTYMAKKLCQWASEVFDLAYVENNDFSNNPCRSIMKHLPNHEAHHMARIRCNELGGFVKTLETYQGYMLTKAAIWILLYTGMRQASIRNATWQDFDFKTNTWNRKPEKLDKFIHPLPLPTLAIALLNEIKPLTGGKPEDLVFPSVRNVNHRMSEAAICQALDRMGFRMVGHGLRGVVSTGLNELGFKPHVVEVQIGHKRENAVEAAYNDAEHFEERRKMMQDWADYLDKLVESE
jgi:integrase